MTSEAEDLVGVLSAESMPGLGWRRRTRKTVIPTKSRDEAFGLGGCPSRDQSNCFEIGSFKPRQGSNRDFYCGD
jgi:hypothetical protein